MGGFLQRLLGVTLHTAIKPCGVETIPKGRNAEKDNCGCPLESTGGKREQPQAQHDGWQHEAHSHPRALVSRRGRVILTSEGEDVFSPHLEVECHEAIGLCFMGDRAAPAVGTSAFALRLVVVAVMKVGCHEMDRACEGFGNKITQR